MFDDYSRPGTCDVCNKKAPVVVHASTYGAISNAYCKACFEKQLEPYQNIVSYICCAGRFPDDINSMYIEDVRRILKEMGISEEKFIKDVDDAINEDFAAHS